MINKVKELLTKQAEERLSLATKVVAKITELVQVVKDLGCEHLLNGLLATGEVKEVIKEVPVEIVREVEVVKEIEVVVDNKDLIVKLETANNKISVLEADLKKATDKISTLEADEENLPSELTKRQVGTIKAQRTTALNKLIDAEKEIADLKVKVAELENLRSELNKYKKSSATWQSKYDELKKQVDIKEEPVVIEEVPVAKETVEAPTTEEKSSKNSNKGNGRNRNTRQNQRQRRKEEKENNKDVQDEPIVLSSNNISLNECTSYKRRRTDIHMYDGGQCYVLASEKCQQITVVPKKASYVVTDELVDAYQKALVNIGYNPTRTNVSPVVIQHSEGEYKGYFARTDALAGVETFSAKDVFAGYVYKGNKGYLFTWDKNRHDIAAVYKLVESVKGQSNANSITSATVLEISAFISKMFDLYDEQVQAIVAERNEIARQKAEESRKQYEANCRKSQEDKDKINAARTSGNVLGSRTRSTTPKRVIKKNNANTVKVSDLSESLQGAAADFC